MLNDNHAGSGRAMLDMRQPRSTAEPEVERLAAVVTRAHTELMAALAELQSLRQELGSLVAWRLTRPWSAEEFGRYLRITAAERKAHRRYLAARTWFHAALKRIRHLLPSRESVQYSNRDVDEVRRSGAGRTGDVDGAADRLDPVAETDEP
jgi:hypothetical protein